MRQPHPNHNKTMIHQTDSKSPQPVAEAESSVEVTSTALFEVDCWAYGSVNEPTISNALAKNRVVKITPTKNGKFEVREMCDEYFGATLTAEQLAEWGRELIALSSANTINQVAAKKCGEALSLARELRDVLSELEYSGNEKGTRCIDCGMASWTDHSPSCKVGNALAKAKEVLP